MPFLFPALASAVCDIGILYLGHRSYLLEQKYHGVDGILIDVDDDTSRRVYHYGYIVWLAAIRLFLLLVPLPYHSFLGKALRCPILYRLFYAATLVILFIHALTLLMIDPGSLSSLLKAISSYSNEGESSGTMHHILVTRSLWVALTLTLVSTLNHIALIFHVRSTAPVDAELFGGRQRPKVLLYYAKEKKQLNTNGNGQSGENTEREGLLSGSGNFVLDDDGGPPTIGIPMGAGENGFGRNSSHSSSGRAFKEMSNKLMMEIQVRLRKAKGDWTKRLEDYQKPLRTAAAASHSDRQSLHHLSLNSNVAPFRVILELFAGDNNFNHNNNDHGSISRLDAVYDLDDGAALMLFVPQLMSFLLHGAYESSYQLEEWILETCRKNLFFAHKCYWFLKAWSLETSSSALHLREGGDPLLSPRSVSRLSHSSSLTSFATQEDDSNNESKLLPEERAVIEDLMRKIMKCGEEPARLLHFGSTVGKLHLETTSTATTLFSNDSFYSAKSSASSLTPSGAAKSHLIPVNPLTGVPSKIHFECLAAQRSHGFLPLDNGAMLNATYNQSILNGNPCGTSYFDSCPVFMDALITIAENLFKVPRDLRKAEFQKQLRLLEVEALPCNEIYIPLQDFHHRVWRIVAEESIPLSTKERVPCIICLEVLGYTPEQSGDRDIGSLFNRRALTGSNKTITVSEREMVDTWRNSRRNPYRRETAFNRVTQGMGKIPDKMKESMQEMHLSMQEMQEQIRHNISNMREMADGMHHNEYWSAHNTTESLEDTNGNRINGDDNVNVNGNVIGISKETKPNPESPKRDHAGDDTLRSGASSPSKVTQPTSPSTPRSTIPQGAMGQWTKSPAPQGSKKSTSPSQIIEISDSALQDLSTPSMVPKYKSYQAVNTHATSITSRRRLARSSSNSNSSRANKLKLEINVGYSNGDDGDDENDYSGHETNGDSIDAGTTPSFSNTSASGHSKPPSTPSKPPPVVFKENWKEKEERLRVGSAYGNHPGWKLLPVLVKANDDLRQEQLASQLIQRMALILARDQVPVWLCPYEILALDASGGIIEAIPDTISLASLKKNDLDYTDLKGFFEQYFDEDETLADAKANFCESLAAYSIACFLLQIKDRHNGNILLDNRGHLIHIDFGFFFLSSPGKNTGFESAPFKLTREFMTVLGGPDSHLFGVFRTLCYRTFLSLRKHCHEIILLVEMLQLGNEELACFRGRPDDAIRELRQRFRLDLNDRACLEYVNALVDESLENWRTNWYDRYQRYCVGVL